MWLFPLPISVPLPPSSASIVETSGSSDYAARASCTWGDPVRVGAAYGSVVPEAVAWTLLLTPICES